MFSFSSLRYAACLAALLLAACGSDPRIAGAQDLSVLFHQPADQQVQRAQVRALPARRGFSTTDPARIMVIGDSLAQGFGIFLDRRVKERDLAAVVANRGRTSTGLSRSDFYDWPANFAAQAASLQPDVIVVHFGANDNQGVVTSSGTVHLGSDRWEDAYRDQTRRILDVAARTGAMVYWIGPAPDRGAGLNRHLARINPVFAEEAQATGAIYFPLSSFAAGPNGEYMRAATVNGRAVTIRSGDGSHFTGEGYYMVADRLLADLEGRVPSIFNAGELELAGILQ